MKICHGQAVRLHLNEDPEMFSLLMLLGVLLSKRVKFYLDAPGTHEEQGKKCERTNYDDNPQDLSPHVSR